MEGREGGKRSAEWREAEKIIKHNNTWHFTLESPPSILAAHESDRATGPGRLACSEPPATSSLSLSLSARACAS